MLNVCDTGAAVKEERIEIQEDKRTEAARIFPDAAFLPVVTED